LDDSNKDHEFKLLGNLMACLHPDSLWNTKGLPFLDRETELELFHPTGPLALHTIINKELHIREFGIGITYGLSYPFIPLRKDYFFRKILCGQTDSVVALFKQMDGTDSEKLFLIDLIETAGRENCEEACIQLMALYLDKWPRNLFEGGAFFLTAARIGSDPLIDYVEKSFRNNLETHKVAANLFYTYGLLEAGKYFQAQERIPEDYSYNAEMQFLSHIIGADITETNSCYYNSNRNLSKNHSDFFRSFISDSAI
ncbi:MAG: hypothetical protein ACKOSR_13145, partial [Flavobacteriales bacterium]